MTFTASSCKSLSHELAQGTAPRRARLPSRQSERGAAAGGARPDRARRALPVSPLPMPRGWPVSARRRPTGIFATAMSCCPDRAARLRAVRGVADAGLGRRPPRHRHGVRAGRQGLSRLRAQRAGVLFGDVRIRASRRCQSDVDGRQRAGFRHHPRRSRTAGSACAARHAAAAGDDDGAAHLVDVARRGVAVRHAATRRAASCRCRRKICWKPKC